MPPIKSPEKRFFDESYKQKTAELQLLIQASKTHLLLAYFDISSKQMVGMEERYLSENNNWHQVSEELKSIFSEEGFKGEFKSVSFSLIDSHYTLVPSALFDANKLDSYLNFNHKEEDLEASELRHEEVNALSSQIVYAFPEILKSFLEKRFEYIQIHHYTAPLLEAFSLSRTKEDTLHVHVQLDRFDVIYYADQKLQLLNSFPYQTVEDFIYYLLYLMEQLKIDRNHIELKLYGEFEERSALFDILIEYVRHPIIINRTKAIQYSQPLNQIPLHKYYNLFNQYLCG